MDAAVAAVLSKVECSFHIKRRTKDGTEGIPHWTACFKINKANGSLGKSRIKKYTEALRALVRDLLGTKASKPTAFTFKWWPNGDRDMGLTVTKTRCASKHQSFASNKYLKSDLSAPAYSLDSASAKGCIMFTYFCVPDL